MAPRAEYSKEVKNSIIQLLRNGKKQKEVASIIGCSQGMVSKLWAKYRNTGMVENRNRCGRPQATTPRQDKQLIRLCRQMRKSTSQQMNNNWAEMTGSVVTARTLRNRLHEKGYSYAKAKTKPYLTPKHRKTRLRWAKERRNWTEEEWGKVIFSDESKICIGGGGDVGRFVWRLPAEKFHPQCLRSSVKFPSSLMIWGCMSARGLGNLCILKTTVNSDVYRDILEAFLLPTVEDQFGDTTVTFQDDNAACHRGRIVKAYLHEVGIPTMTWPPQSPDLNPIENVWWELKKRVQAAKPATTDQLSIAIKNSWSEIPVELCKQLVQSMPKRIRAVIKARGGATQF